MYIIRTEISQEGTYTSTFLKDKEGRDCRIGNWEGEIIAELQEKLSQAEKDYAECQEQHHDIIHRRNLQIADLKKKLELAYEMGIKSTYSQAKGKSMDKKFQKLIE